MAKKEFNDQNNPRKPLSPEEKQELEKICKNLKEAKVRDPDFMEKEIQKWVEVEAVAHPDAFDDLTTNDMKQELKKSVAPKPGRK